MTKLLVLGILYEKSMSGYDIQNVLKMTDAERWGGVLSGSIYYALSKLEKDNYIEISSIKATGHRQKAIYTITEKGKEYLKQLVCEGLKESSLNYPTALYSAVSYMDTISKESAMVYLSEHKTCLLKEYETLQRGLEEKKRALNNQLSSLTELIFEDMFQSVKNQLEFIEKVMKII